MSYFEEKDGFYINHQGKPKEYVLRLFKHKIPNDYKKYWNNYADNYRFHGNFFDFRMKNGFDREDREKLFFKMENKSKIKGLIIFDELEDYSFLRDEPFVDLQCLWIYHAYALKDLGFVEKMHNLNQLLIVDAVHLSDLKHVVKLVKEQQKLLEDSENEKECSVLRCLGIIGANLTSLKCFDKFYYDLFNINFSKNRIEDVAHLKDVGCYYLDLSDNVIRFGIEKWMERKKRFVHLNLENNPLERKTVEDAYRRASKSFFDEHDLDLISVNRICCTICGDIIDSNWGWDYRRCFCDNSAVDGGRNYLRRCGEPGTIMDLSEYYLQSEFEEDEDGTFFLKKDLIAEYDEEEDEDLFEDFFFKAFVIIVLVLNVSMFLMMGYMMYSMLNLTETLANALMRIL